MKKKTTSFKKKITQIYKKLPRAHERNLSILFFSSCHHTINNDIATYMKNIR